MKHVHCDIIKAWADGAEIQVHNKRVGTDWQEIGGTPMWEAGCDYRIKPEVRSYRIALLKKIEGVYTLSVDNEKDELSVLSQCNFIKWLTYRIEYTE